VDLGARGYDVFVGTGAVDAALGVAIATGGRLCVLCDGTVAGLHGEGVLRRIRVSGARAHLVPLPPGEAAKTLGAIEEACRSAVAPGFERGDVVVGLGGGAATDAAGFAAAVLLRGVRWVALPTTLLGQVDAAIGGKTGVNLPEGKNLVGAFHQPIAVGCDPAFLATLRPREYRSGLAEVVKTAWIGDRELFERLERDPPLAPDHPSIAEIVRRCVVVKARIVARDEKEQGSRAQLNFGHTLGHAIETEGGGRWLHGEAVALGMVGALHMSVETGRCDASLLERLVRLLDAIGLPTRDPALDPDAVVARTRVDKKRREGEDGYQLTVGLGSISVARDLPGGASRAAVEFLRRPLSRA
jgi:3-dehydroquinate synthase